MFCFIVEDLLSFFFQKLHDDFFGREYTTKNCPMPLHLNFIHYIFIGKLDDRQMAYGFKLPNITIIFHRNEEIHEIQEDKSKQIKGAQSEK